MSDDAFLNLVDLYYASLYRFALSLARNSADACDLTQQTFLVWATKGHSLREISKAKTWLFTTLYREFLKNRRRSVRETPMPEEGHPILIDTDTLAESIRRADTNHVMDALSQIDENHRAPLTLFYLEDLSYQEIAETLDIPAGTVMSRLSRGKAQLRALLAEPPSANVIPFPSTTRRTKP